MYCIIIHLRLCHDKLGIVSHDCRCFQSLRKLMKRSAKNKIWVWQVCMCVFHLTVFSFHSYPLSLVLSHSSPSVSARFHQISFSWNTWLNMTRVVLNTALGVKACSKPQERSTAGSGAKHMQVQLLLFISVTLLYIQYDRQVHGVAWQIRKTTYWKNLHEKTPTPKTHLYTFTLLMRTLTPTTACIQVHQIERCHPHSHKL